MRIVEIVKNMASVPRTVPRAASLTQQYMSRAQKTNYKIKDYPVYQIKPGRGASIELMLFIGSKDGSQLLGEMALLNHPYDGEKFVFSEVFFDPEIQGKGIAKELYKLAIVEYGYTVVSDESQTSGSEKLWNNLARDPELTVYVWDFENDTYRDFDPNDPDDVYYDQQEMNNLKAEIENTVKKLEQKFTKNEITKKEYDQLIDRYVEPIYAEIESLGRTQDMRLVATKKI